MGSAAKAQEPTMEEILASIRRIIADDDAAAIADEGATIAIEEPVVKAAVGSEMNQEDIDAMLADFDPPPVQAPSPRLKAVKTKAEPEKIVPDFTEDDDILELTPSAQVKPAKEPEQVALDVMDDFDDLPAAPPPKAAKPEFPAPSIGDVEFRDAEPEAKADPSPAAKQDVPAPQPAPSAAHTLLSEQTNAAVANAFGSLSNTIFSQKPRTMDELVQEMLRPMLKNWLDDNLPEMVEGLVRAEIERISRGR